MESNNTIPSDSQLSTKTDYFSYFAEAIEIEKILGANFMKEMELW